MKLNNNKYKSTHPMNRSHRMSKKEKKKINARKVMKTLLVIAVLLVVLISTTNAQTQSDKSDAVWTIVVPVAACLDIDMKKCLVGESKDSVVTGFVQNTGAWKCRVDSIYFRGADAAAFGLVSGMPVYTVLTGESHAGEFHFVPSRVGIHTAEIVIITQSDTLYQKITGEGIQPQLKVMNDIIDFGVINVGNKKDTLQALTIKNIGSAPIVITGTKHNKPNDIDFTTIAGGGNFTLNAGEVCKMDLRFAPSSPGRTSGLLEFHYNGIGSPAIVQLFGEGIEIKPKITTDATPFVDLICASLTETKVKISNKGGLPLIIEEINKIGADANQFIVNETMPITIEKDSVKEISVQFRPTSAGTKTIDLEIKSNADPDTLIKVPMSARKDSVNISFLENTIDLGYLCPNEAKDSLMNIKNFGTIKTGAYLINSSNISLGKNEVVVQDNTSDAISFNFKGISTEGIFSETITITDSICGYTKTITISGIVQSPTIESLPITITCLVGQSKDGILAIENKSDRTVVIQNAPVISAPFSLVGNPFPLTIPAKTIKNITLHYAPTDNTVQTNTLQFVFEPCSMTYETMVTGVPASATALIQTDSLWGYPGDTLDIPIILKNESNLANAGVTSFNTDLIFNPTLLTPLDRIAYPVQGIDDKKAKIELKNLPIASETGKPLIKIPFVVGLGNEEKCLLILGNTIANGGIADIQSQDGKFTLLGICREGGSRLFNPTGKVEIMQINPNPASEDIEIKVNLIEDGATSVSVFNSNGLKIKGFNFSGETGLKTINLDVREFSNGLYFIQLQTPTVLTNQKLMIIR